jgi:signal peptidase I
MFLFVILAGLTFLLAQGVVKVDGGSMAPGIAAGSWCLVRPFGKPLPGDRVVLRLHDDRRILKRLVAVPGEVVAFEDGALVLPEPPSDGLERRGSTRWRASRTGSDYDRNWPARICSQKSVNGSLMHPEGMRCTERGAQLDPGQIFVLSDNRSGSEDSRTFGALPAAMIEAAIGWCL